MVLHITCSCANGFAVDATASTTPAGDCEDNTVRLVDGVVNLTTQTMNGRLEICINNAWGSICNNSFRVLDAEVACHQLTGFERQGELPCQVTSLCICVLSANSSL